MNVTIDPSWKKALEDEFGKPYFENLTAKVRGAYLKGGVFPPPKMVFNALNLCPFERVRVVILGQDPYHGAGQAHGLSFSVPEGVRPPPSLQNIYKEIAADIGTPIPQSGSLERWAAQGVLLLNATLTVENGKPGSHQGWGWETFTDAIIKTISDQKEHVVFLLWGNYARAKKPLIDTTKHCVLEAPHPSPFSAHSGFFGSKHFSKTNTYLQQHGKEPIMW
ncbi:MAG TPA: uracil-DNA glycosylase [Candidatus Paceibacterota bacterium]